MFYDPNRDIFKDTGGWSVVHHVYDDWELNVIRAAFTRAEIPFKTQESRDSNGRDRLEIAVPLEVEEDATELLLRVVDAVSREERHEEASDEGDEPFIRATPTDVPVEVIASRDDLGAILRVEGYGYELKVGPEPHLIVTEDQWEEFTDFSAQRQEFAILLEKEYEPLYRWLRNEKRFGDFLRLVESTYRGSPDEDMPEDFLRAAGWMLAVLVAIAGLVVVFRWLEGMTVGAAG